MDTGPAPETESLVRAAGVLQAEIKVGARDL
jgi:hypothetical protein